MFRIHLPRILSASLPYCLFLLCFMSPAPASGQVLYTIRDLGGVVGSGTGFPTIGIGVNNAGQVTGRYYASPGVARAFRTAPGGTTSNPGANLGVAAGFTGSLGTAINASGQVVGVNQGVIPFRAFRTSATGLISDPGTDLGVLPGMVSSWAHGINASGQAVGSSSASGPSPLVFPFRTSATGLVSDAGTNLGSFGGTQGDAFGINDAGQVTGYSNIPGEIPHAFRTTSTGTLSNPGADIGTLGFSSRGRAINAAGQVTGDSQLVAGGPQHAFRTTANGLVSDPGADLGVLPGYSDSIGTSINALGVVAGYLVNFPETRAFIYDTQWRDLNNLIEPGSGWVLTRALGINDIGMITGEGLLNGDSHAFLLIPVPEPSTLTLVGVSSFLGWLTRLRLARRQNQRCVSNTRKVPC